jgi:VWFA-related protein
VNVSRFRIAALLLLLPLPVGAQDNPGRTAPAEATTVLVDVVVRDKKGQPVTSLTASDFDVLEDGVPQKIGQFALAGAGGVTAESGTTAPAPPTANADAAAASTAAPGAASSTPVTIAFVFDRLSTEGRVAAQKAVHAFAARKNVAARAGLFSLEGTLVVLQDFTTDPALTVAAVDGLSMRLTQVGSTVTDRAKSQAQNHVRANADAATLSYLLQSSHSGKGSGAVVMAEIRARQSSMAAAVEDAFDGLDRDQHGYMAANALMAIVEALRSVPGRKAIVLFSEGLYRTEANQDRFLSVVNAANRASVSVYAVEASGLSTESLDALSHDELESTGNARIAMQESGKDSGGGAMSRGLERVETLTRYNPRASLEWMADSTGGIFFHDTNEFDEPLGRVESDLKSYYLVGYTPSNETYDGRFRKITVKVKGSGLSVRARSGYFAIRSVGPVLTHVAPPLAVLESGKKPHAFEVFAGAWPFPEDKRAARVPVVISVPGRILPSLISKKSTSVDLTLVARILDAKGVPVEAMSRRFALDAAGITQSRDADLRLSRDAWLPPGHYTLEAVAYEATSQKASVVTAPLEVLDGAGAIDRVQVVVVRQALPKATVGADLESGHPLVFGDAVIQPLAGEPYPHGPNNRLVVQVTASPAAGARAPTAELGLWQGEHRLEQRMVAWDRPEPSGLVRHVGELPIATLAPGQYEVRVEVSEGDRKRRLSVPFTVQ